MGKLGYAPRLMREIWQFARENKVYWLVPMVLLLGLTILLIVAGQSSAPFIYTLF